MRLLQALFVICFLTICTFITIHMVKAQSYESVIHEGDMRVKVDPREQHIPFDPELRHLRPPPARIPDEYDIFIGLSVFRDGFRCAKTIFTGFTRAKHPEHLYFGVVDQVNPGDAHCIDEYCKMAAIEWPNHGPCRYHDHIRIDTRLADDSRGPTLARHYQQLLIHNETFCLQLDGHSIFTNGWDQYIVEEWERIDNEMAVLTTYLHHINDFVKENGDNNVPSGWLPHLCTTMRGSNGLVRNIGASMIAGSKFPQMSALWGAGLSFSKCHAEKRVPIDSHTLWMFDGEEFLRASHLWTHGYDLYSPSPHGAVVYHNYSKVPARFEHVKVDRKQKALEEEMGENRFRLIVGMEFTGPVDTYELDKYAFGTVRTFEQYLNFSGVTFEEGKNDTHSCKQLHWVPYLDPTQVEEIVGDGWLLYPERHTSEPPITTETETNEQKEETKEEKEEKPIPLAQEQGEIQDHPLPRTASTSNGSVLVFLVIAVMLFVALSNDRISIKIRRHCRPKKSMDTQ